jgi:acyl carrier protein
MESIRDQVITMVFDVSRPSRPDLSDTGRSLLTSGLDSLDFSTLLMAVEDRFKVLVEEKDVEGLDSIDSIVKFVEEHTASDG